MFSQALGLYAERSDFFAQLTLEHLYLSAIAISIATIAGLVLGIVVSEYDKSSSAVFSLVNFIYTIPSISLLGFLIPFTGIGNRTAVIALTVYALLPMVRNTHAGMKAIDPDVLEAATGMGSTRWQTLYKIKLPLAFPAILAGLRNMVVMTIALAGIASFIGAGGLGVAIYRGITTNNNAMVLAGSLLIAVLALFFDYLLGGMENLVLRKRRMAKASRKSGISLVLALIALFALTTFVIYGRHGKGEIHIATKPMTEQFILSDMLKQLIEHHTDHSVRLTQGVGGGTGNIHPALIKGDFDLYPEYTGTAWAYVLKKTDLPEEEQLVRELIDQYRSQYDLEWVGMYGFNNTYGLAVRRSVADQHGLKTYSDLAPVAPQLAFGAEYDFYEREDGFDALCKTYGLTFNKTVDLDIGLKYQAINAGELDVTVISTADGQVSVSDIVVLEDDKRFFHNYWCGNVVRRDTLERYEGLRAVLEMTENLLTDAEMAKLNYEVESNKRDSREVAREFLQSKNLLR